MSDQETINPKDSPRKFLFDLNHFDEGHEDEVEELEPPPPTFSEEEMEDARRKSYERGKQDGLTEAHHGFEKQVTALLEVIGRDLQTLFKAEQEREARFEAESVMLCRSIFQTILPDLAEKRGLDEITGMIEKVLESQREQEEIIIYVSPQFQDAIIQKISAYPSTSKVNIRIEPDNALGPMDCKMEWNGGGAIKDMSALSERIKEELNALLKGKPLVKDAEVTDNGNEASSEEAPAQDDKSGEDKNE